MAKKLQTSIPGVGYIFQKRYKDTAGNTVAARTWTIRLTDRTCKSTGLEDQAAAFKELLKLAGQNASGISMPSTKGTVGELLDLSFEAAKAKGNRSLSDKKGKLDLMKEAFGSVKISEFRVHHATAWLNRKHMKHPGQKTEPTEPIQGATKRRYIAELKMAFRLGMQTDPQLCTKIPPFPKYTEDNVREGVLERKSYEVMRGAFLQEHARLFFVIGYHLGMRSGEIFSLKWDQVDLEARTIKLRARQTKGKAARVAPIYGDMVPFLEMARASAAPTCDRVIQLNGKPVNAIYKSWRTACKTAGVTLLPHDLRRTAVTNMIKAGIPTEVVMSISGHKTNSMLKRYMILDTEAAIRAGEQMEQWMGAPSTRKAEPSTQIARTGDKLSKSTM